MAKKKVVKAKEKVKFSLTNELHAGILELADVARDGSVRLKRTDLKKLLDEVFEKGIKAAASGERIRVSVLGSIGRKEVKARKAGKGTNPFTGEPMIIKARPTSKKPRFTFSKASREIIATKRYW